MHKRWEEAERRCRDIAEQYGSSAAAPEAVYWAGVASYKRTNDHHVLAPVCKELTKRFPDSIWTKKASVWSE